MPRQKVRVFFTVRPHKSQNVKLWQLEYCCNHFPFCACLFYFATFLKMGKATGWKVHDVNCDVRRGGSVKKLTELQLVLLCFSAILIFGAPFRPYTEKKID